MDAKLNEFISIKVNPPLVIGKTIFNLNYTRDGGQTFREETNQILYGTYFFLGQNVDEYTYEAVNFISLVSELGGFIEIMYITLMLIPWVYNTKLAQKKFIDKLYFIDRAKENNQNFNRTISNIERFESVAAHSNHFTEEETK
jgi:hypothetical protein